VLVRLRVAAQAAMPIARTSEIVGPFVFAK
jgi:hypothetical protein